MTSLTEGRGSLHGVKMRSGGIMMVMSDARTTRQSECFLRPLDAGIADLAVDL